MPFTPAHPAIILPLLRINPGLISATGLIVGSMAPDFEYFFTMSVNGDHGHTLAGILYFDLPVSCLLSLVFHQVIKIKLIGNLPPFFQRRLITLRDFDFIGYVRKYYVVFFISVVIGSASHIFWDGFTHADGFFVNALSFYHGKFIPYDGVKYPLWYALQNISSVVGVTIVLGYITFLKPSSAEIKTISWLYWLFIFTFLLITIFIRFQFEPWNADLGIMVVSSVSGICLAFTVAGLLPFRTTSHG